MRDTYPAYQTRSLSVFHHVLNIPFRNTTSIQMHSGGNKRFIIRYLIYLVGDLSLVGLSSQAGQRIPDVRSSKVD